MISSGMKRGLAAAAVNALKVTGLPEGSNRPWDVPEAIPPDLADNEREVAIDGIHRAQEPTAQEGEQ